MYRRTRISVHLPREAFFYGAVPYLVVYTFWLLAAGLPMTLLQLAMGQLSQQDPNGYENRMNASECFK
ncbi:Transporter [Operophtera brumata]|uniref:Transporter n=1 Tax=Operophtera brumata TaxID=104452 RepID=A0A0L7LNL2_OPEBR|nr:Transporter [Operophtera brumata]